MKKAALLLTILLFSTTLMAKTIELEVFRDWRGNNCEFKSSRPFFTITDVYDLEQFWEKANADESMPWLDFEKYMLLVWNPGPSLFDHDPVKINKFLYKDGRFIAIMDLEKKQSGGFWRRPFVATLLPRIKKGDIFIMRKIEVGFRKFKYENVFTLWDMSADRSMPFDMVKLDEPVGEAQFIDPTRYPKDEQPGQMQIASRPPAQPITTTAAPQADENPFAEAVEKPAAPAQKPVAALSEPQQPVSASAVPVKKPVSTTALVAEAEAKDKDGDFFPDFGTPESDNKKPEVQSKPAKTSTAPAVDEDPLFGEEFDINF